jgi:hypothetical protein
MSKTPSPNIEFTAIFHVDRDRPPGLEDGLAQLFQLREHLRACSPMLSTWYLGGNTKQEALLYEAFDETGPTTALLAVLKERERRTPYPHVGHGVGLWNGEDPPNSASVLLHISHVQTPSLLSLTARIPEFLSHEKVLATTLKIVEVWKPLSVAVHPYHYDAVFKARPGAGWMLYLPRELSAQQVPEAQELVPVTERGAKGKAERLGTVIVSIGGNEPFSEQNLEHVKRAHDIEIRLVGQDLLPSFRDFQRPPP